MIKRIFSLIFLVFIIISCNANNLEKDTENILKVIPEIKEIKDEKEKDLIFSINLAQEEKYYEFSNYINEIDIKEDDINKTSFAKKIWKSNMIYNISHNENKENKKEEKIKFWTYTTWWNENLKINWENIVKIEDDIQSPWGYDTEIKSIENLFKFTWKLNNAKRLSLFVDWKNHSWTEKNPPKKIIIYFDKIWNYIKNFIFEIKDKRKIKEIYYITESWEKLFFDSKKIWECKENCFNLDEEKYKNYYNWIGIIKKDLKNIDKIEILF